MKRFFLVFIFQLATLAHSQNYANAQEVEPKNFTISKRIVSDLSTYATIALLCGSQKEHDKVKSAEEIFIKKINYTDKYRTDLVIASMASSIVAANSVKPDGFFCIASTVLSDKVIEYSILLN